ncbi:MAG: hypothetical protein SFX18_05935 [Pirellulales bacterium]|nr:hypothetical protein [Pirellulales bacterium]
MRIEVYCRDRELPAPMGRGSGFWLLLAFCALPLVVGCGKSQPERLATFPVEGRLLVNNQPLPHAQIILHPSAAGSPALAARAQTDKEGNFTVTTYETGDGAATGEYKITVQHYPLVKNGESYERGENSLPAKYSDPNTTDWKVTVGQAPTKIPAKNITR